MSQQLVQLLVRVPEAANSLGISRAELYKMLARGEITAVHLGRAVRIPVAELERWVKAKVAAAQS